MGVIVAAELSYIAAVILSLTAYECTDMYIYALYDYDYGISLELSQMYFTTLTKRYFISFYFIELHIASKLSYLPRNYHHWKASHFTPGFPFNDATSIFQNTLSFPASTTLPLPGRHDIQFLGLLKVALIIHAKAPSMLVTSFFISLSHWNFQTST